MRVSKVDRVLCVLLMLFVSVSFLSYYVFWGGLKNRFLGSYFEDVIILIDEGERVEFKSRINFNKQGLIEFQKNGSWSRSAYREIVERSGGVYSFKTISANSDPVRNLSKLLEGNSDLSFNHAYYLKKGGLHIEISMRGRRGGAFMLRSLLEFIVLA